MIKNNISNLRNFKKYTKHFTCERLLYKKKERLNISTFMLNHMFISIRDLNLQQEQDKVKS